MLQPNGTRVTVRAEERREVRYLRNGTRVTVIKKFRVISANDLCHLIEAQDAEYYAKTQSKYAEVLGGLW